MAAWLPATSLSWHTDKYPDAGGLDPVRIKAYRDLESKDKLTVRIQGSWDFNTRYVTTTLEEQAKTFMTRDKRGDNSPLINVDGVKVYMDGVRNDAEGGSTRRA